MAESLFDGDLSRLEHVFCTNGWKDYCIGMISSRSKDKTAAMLTEINASIDAPPTKIG